MDIQIGVLQMIASIVSVGNEVVIGQIADTNAAWLSQELAGLGIEVVEHAAVGDDMSRIVCAVKSATNRVDLIIVTGGLGPTPDDLTRQAMADAAKQDLVLDQEALEHISLIFSSRHLEMPERNRVQAMIPKGAVLIPNNRGTAAGFRIQIGKCEIAALPGVPHEMKGMFEDELAPYLRTVSGDSVVMIRSIRTFGVPESLVGQKLEHLMGLSDNPLVGTLAQDGVITVKLTVRAPDRKTAVELLDIRECEIRSLLGDAVFGTDVPGLEYVVAELLERRNWTAALAESCTGGMVASRLTSVPGISRCFVESVVTYSNESKSRRLDVPPDLIEKHGAVSSPVAEAMAVGVRDRAGSDVSIALTGIAGPTGGTTDKPVGLVYIATVTPDGVEVSEHRFRGERNIIRDRAAKTALNLLRLRLMKE